jgi:mono/diheme cytochrome c family protein
LPRDIPREAARLTAPLGALLLLLAGSPAEAAEEASPARGAYLAAAAGCDQCHTDTEHAGRPYAGGRALETPFGTVFAPNITTDPETGIGRWRHADFARALCWGIAPDDSHYLPVFPFPFYNRLRDDDLADLEAFLQTVPAVSQVSRASSVNILSAARTRAAITVLAEHMPGPWQSDPTKDRPWDRGAYLVATIGRCGDCHTPRNWVGALDSDRALSGVSVGPGGKAVPNITPDPETGIGKWSEDDITTLLKNGQTPDFDFVGGAMAEVVKNTARLDDADRRAIAVYLRSIPAIRSQKRVAHQ